MTPPFASSRAVRITETAFAADICTALSNSEISLAEWDVLSESILTSSATTANPRPYSPALAASIAAFNASRLV
jgi:hypothetical protein